MLLQVKRTDGLWYWAEYSTFSISDEVGKYRLTVDGYSGDAGDSLMNVESKWVADGRPFSTADNDNDDSGHNCAELEFGGWWFGTWVVVR